MSRKKSPSVPSSIDLQFNSKTGLYETIENGITYQLTYSQMNGMKMFFKHNGYMAQVNTWFNSLTKVEKKAVKRTGEPKEPDDFIPDREWED